MKQIIKQNKFANGGQLNQSHFVRLSEEVGYKTLALLVSKVL